CVDPTEFLHLSSSSSGFEIYHSTTLRFDLLGERFRPAARHNRVERGEFENPSQLKDAGVKDVQNILFLEVPVENRCVIVYVQPSLVGLRCAFFEYCYNVLGVVF